ncbi:sulfurtransferase [Vibrio mediterranei]
MNRLCSIASILVTWCGVVLPSWAATWDQLVNMSTVKNQVIDCRTSNVFNGWGNDATNEQGGHFPNASNIELPWLLGMSQDQKDALFTANQLDKSKTTYVYCEQPTQRKIIMLLREQGFKQVEGVEQSFNQYLGKKEALANYQALVPVIWVKKLIEGGQVPHPPKSNYKIVEVAWGLGVKYLVSHIPSALYLDTNDIESEPLWNKVSDDKLAETFKKLGIRHDSTVILYGRDQTAAARAATILLYSGVQDVRLVNGGWQAWQQAHYPTEALENVANPVDFGASLPLHPELFIGVEKARVLLADQAGSSLVSIRSWPEYIGETSGYNYIQSKGRIAGSKWGHAGSDAYHMEDFNNPDNTMISEKVIRKFWHDWHIDAAQNVSFYCGTGWRASEAFFYAYVMGWKHISVFDGGWYEWSADYSNPIEAGEITQRRQG